MNPQTSSLLNTLRTSPLEHVQIIEKTTRTITRTTISVYTESNKHEFDNTDPQSSSGVYQWVNKVLRCQMYNYITIPEPAAFLMTLSVEANPILESPLPLTESASDLHEVNYAAIGVR